MMRQERNDKLKYRRRAAARQRDGARQARRAGPPPLEVTGLARPHTMECGIIATHAEGHKQRLHEVVGLAEHEIMR
jgi:hypothetical protein